MLLLGRFFVERMQTCMTKFVGYYLWVVKKSTFETVNFQIVTILLFHRLKGIGYFATKISRVVLVQVAALQKTY